MSVCALVNEKYVGKVRKSVQVKKISLVYAGEELCHLILSFSHSTNY